MTLLRLWPLQYSWWPFLPALKNVWAAWNSTGYKNRHIPRCTLPRPEPFWYLKGPSNTKILKPRPRWEKAALYNTIRRFISLNFQIESTRWRGSYIGSSNEWPPAELEAANNIAIKNWKVFFGVGTYFKGNIIDHMIIYFYVIWRVEFPVVHFIVITFN